MVQTGGMPQTLRDMTSPSRRPGLCSMSSDLDLDDAGDEPREATEEPLMDQIAQMRRALGALSVVEKSCLQSLKRVDLAVSQVSGENSKLRAEVGRLQAQLEGGDAGDATPFRCQLRPDTPNAWMPPPKILQVPDPAGSAPKMASPSVVTDGDNWDETEFKRPQNWSRALTERVVQTTPVSRVPTSVSTRGSRERVAFKRASRSRTTVFADVETMKAKVKDAVMQPVYDVRNFYKEHGGFQKIARSSIFEKVTLMVIALNAIWMAVETDLNREKALHETHAVFQVAEHAFCSYFAMELLVRFMAFQRTRDCLRDHWFVIDAVLMLIMALETWVIAVIIWAIDFDTSTSALGGISVLRLVKLIRLVRMVRMVRLLRATPELMVLIRGAAVAFRSVFFTMCLLILVIYVFSIAFTQLLEGTELGEDYFSSVLNSMGTLLLRGTLPDLADITYRIGDEGRFYAFVFVVFIVLSSVTIMNMLVGVLVEVIGLVSSMEREQMNMEFVKSKLLEMLTSSGLDNNRDMHISKQEFDSLMLNPKAARMVQEVGVDVVGLVEFSDYIFEAHDGPLSFVDFMDVVMSLRGSNSATVKDIVDMRQFVVTEMRGEIKMFTRELKASLAKQWKDTFVHQRSQSGGVLPSPQAGASPTCPGAVARPPDSPGGGGGQSTAARRLHGSIPGRRLSLTSARSASDSPSNRTVSAVDRQPRGPRSPRRSGEDSLHFFPERLGSGEDAPRQPMVYTRRAYSNHSPS